MNVENIEKDERFLIEGDPFEGGYKRPNECEKFSSIFDKDVEKVYSVKFMEYTNYSKTTVAHNTKPMTYLEVGDKPFLVRSSDLQFYSNYGGGYKSIDFVGMITKDTKGDIR